jgi:hypothetical protein
LAGGTSVELSGITNCFKSNQHNKIQPEGVMATTWDLFHQAALVLVGAGPIKQRLALAWRRHLHELDAESLPRELRGDFLALSDSLTSERAVGGLGVIEASVRKMSDSQACHCAERIVDLFGTLSESQAHSARPHGLRAVNGPG